jgi:hypothetical protein
MSINVQIERVILDGLQLSRRERDALAPAIARELRRLASEPANGVAAWGEIWRQGPGSSVDGIAREVASAVQRAATAARPGTGPAARGGRR